MVHSQGGGFGFKVLEARPDKVKALIAVEPSRRAQGQGRGDQGHAYDGHLWRQRQGPSALGQIRQRGVDYTEALKAAGGSVDVIDLPDIGLKGNSHMVMMDKNSDQVADVIQKWLVDARDLRTRCGAAWRLRRVNPANPCG